MNIFEPFLRWEFAFFPTNVSVFPNKHFCIPPATIVSKAILLFEVLSSKAFFIFSLYNIDLEDRIYHNSMGN